jgi:hypothetical protein
MQSVRRVEQVGGDLLMATASLREEFPRFVIVRPR